MPSIAITSNICSSLYNSYVNIDFSHIRPLGALAVDICICFHDIES